MTVGRELQAAFSQAVQEALKRRHDLVCLEHVLLALLEAPATAQLIEACGADLGTLRAGLEAYLGQLEGVPDGSELALEQTLAVTRVLQRAADHVLAAQKQEMDAGDLLAAMLKEENSWAVELLRREGVERLTLLEILSAEVPGRGGEEPEDQEPAAAEEGDAEGEERRGARDPLQAYAVDLVERAAAGEIDPLVGRTAELARVAQVLCRRRKNNPVLVGEAGVGKTAVAEGLALAIHRGEVPGPLAGAEVFALDMGAVIAGTKYRGEFEQRLKGVIEAVARRPGAILFIDEIHTIVGAGAVNGGTMDASNLLKPALASGRLRCIGSTTFTEFQKVFERDRALARRFQKIEIGEPSVPETVRILRGLRARYEEHHGVRYSERALELAAELADRYLPDRHLPDKAIDVMDEAGAAARLRPGPKGRRGTRSVGARDVEGLVAKMAGVPPRRVSTSDRERLSQLETELKAAIYGQDPAVEGLVAAIKLSRAGLGDPGRPVGSFLFSGPTGVGKTELARQLARVLGIELIRFDMSEYMERHAVSRLIGAPPGYVGFDQGGLLTDAIIKTPHAVLLLDEIEKAHPDVFHTLLQVMDHATLTDNSGRKADFRNVVLIMTTNAGAAEAARGAIGFGERVGADDPAGRFLEKAEVEKAFTPEFRNRLDAWISFAALPPAVIARVVDKLVGELQEQLRARKVTLRLSPQARAWLAEHGYDSRNGARPMARLLDRVVRRPLAEAILFGRLQGGGGVCLRVREGRPELEFET